MIALGVLAQGVEGLPVGVERDVHNKGVSATDVVALFELLRSFSVAARLNSAIPAPGSQQPHGTHQAVLMVAIGLVV